MSNSIGDLKNSGLQGNNWPWQYKVLLGLDKIASLIGTSTEYEAQLVTETCTSPASSRILLEVRVWNTDTGTWGPTTYYLPGSSTPVTIAPGCTVAYVDSSAILAQILNVLQDIENGVPEALGQTDSDNSMPVVIANDQSAIPVTLDCGTSATKICFDDGAGPINVNTTNPLPVDATVTVDLNANTDQVGIYGYQDINDPTTPTAISVDVDGHINVNATIDCTTSSIKICDADADILNINTDGSINLGALDATTGTFASLTYTGTGTANALDVNITGGTVTIDCDTSSIAICDGTPGGSNLVINNPGSPADGSINTVLVDLTTGSPAVINPDGTQNNAVYGYDHSTMQNEQITSTGISPTIQALDVNITNTVATAGANSAPVGMYGSTDLGTNWTAVAVDTFGAISTNTTLVGPTGVQPDCDNAISTALCQTQEDILTDIQSSVAPLTSVTPTILISSGDAPVTITVPVYSITFFNNGSVDVNVSVDGGTTNALIPAGVTITMDAGGIKNTYPANTFIVGSTIAVGASMIVTYNS